MLLQITLKNGLIMKRWHSILVFAVLVASSVATSVGSYNAAGRRAELDLNEALGVA